MTVRALEIVIERLVFDGQAPVDAAAVEVAVADEIGRLLASPGARRPLPAVAAPGGGRPASLSRPAGAGEIGAAVARTVHRELGTAWPAPGEARPGGSPSRGAAGRGPGAEAPGR